MRVKLSGFCLVSGLVLLMVLWQSPDTPVMSCFHVSVRLRACSSHAQSHLQALFRVGTWCLDPGTHVLSFRFVSGIGHSCSMFGLILWACGLEFARLRAFLSTCCVLSGWIIMLCFVLCGTSFCFSLAACFHVISSCLNTWLMSFLISYVFVSCFAHGLWFVCWPCACVFVLCEHMAFVLSWVFSVSCALIHLVTWLLVNLPHLSSFVTLLICSLYNLLVFAVLCQFGIVSPWMYSALPCPALSCPVQPCLAKPLPCSCFSPRGSFCFCCCFCFILLIKAHLLHHLVLASSLHPSTLT